MPSLGEIEKQKEQRGKNSTGEQTAFQERVREIQERKVNLAKERNSRVILTRTRDTLNALGIMAAADKAVARLRAGMGYQYDFQEVANLIEEYKSAILQLSEITQKMCEKTDIPYRVPRWVKSIKEGNGKEVEAESGEEVEGKGIEV